MSYRNELHSLKFSTTVSFYFLCNINDGRRCEGDMTNSSGKMCIELLLLVPTSL